MDTTTANFCKLAAAAGLLAFIAACSKAPETVAPAAAAKVSMDEAPLKDADTSCNSACLEDLMQKYFDALAARNPAAAPVTSDVIFSENGG